MGATCDAVPTLRVVPTRAADDPRWDAFVRAHEAGVGFLESRWLEALHREVRTPQHHLLCEDELGRVRGVLPLVATRGLPFGGHLTTRRLASLPRTPVGGPLADSREAGARLVACAADLAEQDGSLLQLKASAGYLDGLLPDLVRRPWRPAYVVELPDHPDDLHFGSARNHARIRTSVRGSERAGLRFRVGDGTDVGRWYRTYLETMRWHGVPARSRRFFDALLAPGGPAHLAVVEHGDGGELIAGAVLLRCAATVSYAFAGVDRSRLHLRPNELLQWHAMRWACEGGHRWYDLGEVSSDNGGLRQFKVKWAPREVELWHHYRPGPPGGTHDAPLRGPIGDLARALWRRAPVRATQVVGGIVNARL